MATFNDPMRNAAALILPPYLYLGSRESTSPAFLKSHQMTHVLSIGSTPLSTDASIVYSHLSLSDDSMVPINETCDVASTIIESAKSGKIVVHCNAARSRSPTVIAAYLMKHQRMTLKDALGLIVQARPAVRPNPGFFRQLKDMDVELNGVSSMKVDTLPRSKQGRLALITGGGVEPDLARVSDSEIDDMGDDETPIMLPPTSPPPMRGLSPLESCFHH